MNRSAPGPGRTLLPLAALALVLLGASLTAVTWQNLSSQRELIDQHVLFAARTVLRGTQSNLLRVLPMQGDAPRQDSCRRVGDYLREAASSGDMVYLGLYDDQGTPLATSLPEGDDRVLPLDRAALGDLAVTGEWYGAMPLGGAAILAYAAETLPALERYCAGKDDDAQGPHPPRYFLVGLSLDEHYAQYQNFKRAALLQTGFVLAAAAFVWLLLLAYLRRREQGGRLKRLEHFQSKLLDALPEALVTLGPQGLVTAANPAARAILGEDPASHPALAGLIRADADLPRGWRQVEHEGKALEVLAVPLEGEILALARDRTELRGLEQSLEQARQLAAIGRLAAGVAHEIRNPLSALRGFAQFFAGRLQGREPEETYARTMVREADRLNRVVTDLVSLAKPRALSPAPVDLAALAADVRALLSFDFETAKADWRTDLARPSLTADPDALRQALVNLVLNALAALPSSGGTLTLSSRATPGGGVALTLSDDGRGMTAEEREHALEPFFTTRKDGYGLGLSLVHKTARDHGADLAIDSAPGRGASVTLSFPAEPQPQEPKP